MLRVPVSKLRRILDSSPGTTLIVTHKNADPDAVASALAMRNLLETKYDLGEVRIGFPEGPSRVSRRLLEFINYRVEYDVEPASGTHGLVMVVDTGSTEQLGAFKAVINRCDRLVVIDHHRPHKSLHAKATLRVISESASSTVEIIVRLFERLRHVPSPELSTLMMAGLLFDTRHFQHSSPFGFLAAYRLLTWGAKPEVVFEALRGELEVPERIARLKAAQRLQLFRIGKWIVVTSTVGAYEASAARALLDLGADVSFVASEDDTTRVSGRASKRFCSETGIHLGRDVMQRLEVKFGGSGGGHALAGGYEGEASAETILGEIVRMLKTLISGSGT